MCVRSLLSLFSGSCGTVGGYQCLGREFSCHLQGRCQPERLQSEFNYSIRNMTFIEHRVFRLRSCYDVTPCILVHTTHTVKMDALLYAAEVGVWMYFISHNM
jgi:hypothetical protein